jgi:hypothetical protein
MVQLFGGVFNTGLDVLRLQVRIIGQDFRFGHPGGQQVQHVLDTDTHAPNAGTAPALLWVKRDSIRMFHSLDCNGNEPFLKCDFIPLTYTFFGHLVAPSRRAVVRTKAEASERRRKGMQEAKKEAGFAEKFVNSGSTIQILD